MGDFEGLSELNRAINSSTTSAMPCVFAAIEAAPVNSPPTCGTVNSPLYSWSARFTLWPRREEVGVIQATLCDDAYLDATRGNFAEADEVIQKNRRTAVLMSPLSRSANTKWTLPERSVYCVTDQIRKTWLSAWTSLPQ